MKSEWRVSKNPAGGKYCYSVYRLYDIQKVDHSGNRATYGLYDNRDEAEAKAAELNRQEEEEWSRL